MSTNSFNENSKPHIFYRKINEFSARMMKKHANRLIFPILGLSSTIWFLMRVIPKPSRATYPCMKVAAPLASGFVAYIIGLATSIFAFRKARAYIREARYIIAGIFIVMALVAGIWGVTHTDEPAYATYPVVQHVANNPMGEGQGINPGRVVWVHDPDATNENFKASSDNAWFLDKNNDMDVIDKMVSRSVRELTGESTDSLAWDALFRYFNQKKHNQDKAYTPGETIFIKINVTSAWGFGESWGNIRSSDYAMVKNQWYGVVETSPHVALAFLRQLINKYGVRQEDIYIGDPMKHIYKHLWDLWYPEFPDVHYVDHDAKLGRTPVKKGVHPLLSYSDRGAVLRVDERSSTPIYEDHLYTVIEDVNYMINLASLKAHERAGITLCAKNHFGSHCRDGAEHLHLGLVAPAQGLPLRDKMGMYRVLVDIMGHKLLGGNTLLFVVDGLWGAPHELEKPVKWKLAPFNDDWPSSIFVSQDQVALESVCFDFLRNEFTSGDYTLPQMGGVDDYLEQAADPSKWPEGITYDPENDGTPLASLGVHEHWNNPDEKQYSRNLGTGEGIELAYVRTSTSKVQDDRYLRVVDEFTLYSNYPNPFNPSTTIRYDLARAAGVKLDIFNMQGQKVKTLVDAEQAANSYHIVWDGSMDNSQPAASGMYFYRLSVSNPGGIAMDSRKMILAK